jgi:hypothetical protein
MSGYAPFGPARFPAARGPATSATTETTAMATASPDDPGGNLMHPGNPMIAFGVIAAIAFGLMAFSTTVRVGKTRAGIQIGETT